MALLSYKKEFKPYKNMLCMIIGLFLGKIHWFCSTVSENFIFRVNSKFVAFSASSGIPAYASKVN